MSENQSISEPSFLPDVNLTDNSTRNATASTATPSSIAVAYTSIVIMALIPIYLGSYRSLKFLNKDRVLMFFLNIFLLIIWFLL